jgi:S1-C subfamily serine protease
VLALGSPFGNAHSLTAGVVSALGRTIESPAGAPIRGALQVDAAINPGSSGGPLLDTAGRMVGVSAMILSGSGVNANVGFAVPVDLVRRGMEGVAGPREPSPAPPAGREEQVGAAVFRKARGAAVFVHAEAGAAPPDAPQGPAGPGGAPRPPPPASGTGIVWDGRGHVVTSYRAVLVADPATGRTAEAERLAVTLADGRTYRARIIGRSLEYRVAVLRVFAPFGDLRPLPLARPEDMRVGQDLFALGNPCGRDHSLSRGVLSAGRDLGAALRGVIQTDAAINPGNVGGPILDSEGSLAGMGLFVEGPGSHAGVNFALSAATLNRIVPILLAKGQVERPELGFVSVAEPDARLRFGVARGALVGSVDAGSPAARAGLRGLRQSGAGDVIVGLGGRPVANGEALWDMVEQEPPGAPLALDVLRDGRRVRIVIMPG